MLSRIKFEIEPLVSEILDQLPQKVWSSKTTTFFDPAIGGGQFVRAIEARLRAAGHSDENINGRVQGCERSDLHVNYAVNKHKLVGKYFVSDFLNKDFRKMKFDVIVGNPPFSKTNEGKQAGKRSIVLYNHFYEKAVKMADIVAMIMPVSSNKQMTKHNNLLKATAHNISYVSDEMQRAMNVIIKMWTVFYDKNKPASKTVDFIADSESGNTIPFTKGKTNLSTIDFNEVKTKEFSIPVIKGLIKDGTQYRYARKSDVKHTLPVGKYAVLMPLCVQAHGWSHTEVIKCNGEAVNVNVYYILADTKKQADEYLKTITEPDFIKQAMDLRGNSNVMTVKALNTIKV